MHSSKTAVPYRGYRGLCVVICAVMLARAGQAQINSQMLIQAHIKASSVIVDFTDKQEADLDKLNEKMDQFIISGLTINALLNLVPKVVDTAISIGNTISGHIGQA